VTIRALIAEDEAPQRRALRELLGSLWPELEVIAECSDGVSAIDALELHRPEIAFLDIRMPGLSGLDVAQRACQNKVHVVFTTAYEEHALRAFETGAIDYVLKPVTAERLGKSLQRVRDRLAGGVPDIAAAIETLRDSLAGSRSDYMRWITATVGNVVKMFAIEDVLFFKSDEKNTRVVSRREEAVIRMTLKELLDVLNPNEFWQIHRSVIVQVRAIKQVKRNDLGSMHVTLDGVAEQLPVSNAYQSRFRGM
jgi:DNA-binding LytR/AlgR family response regulator